MYFKEKNKGIMRKLKKMKKEFLERKEEPKEMQRKILKEKAKREKRNESKRNNINSTCGNYSSVVDIISSNNNICVRRRWNNK